MRVDSRELPLSAIPLCQQLLCYLGPPRPTLSISLYVKGCLDCTIGAFHMSYQRSLLSFRMSSRFSMPSHTKSLLDLVVTTSCGLTLQICLIIALSFRCRCWRFGFVNGQVSLAWSRRLQSGTLVIRLQAQWWREVGWVLSPGEHRPSLQTLYCTPHQHGHGSMHLHTSPAPVAQSKPTSVAQLEALSDWRPWGRGFNTRSATFFCGDWSGNIFYGHSLPSADSRRAVVSFWRKNVHNTG